MTLPRLLPSSGCCVCVCVCVRLGGRPGSLLCTEKSHQAGPSTALHRHRGGHTHTHTLMHCVHAECLHFSISISLLFDTAHFFPPSSHSCCLSFNGFPPSLLSVSLPPCLSSSYVVSCPRNLFRSQPEILLSASAAV